MALNEGNPGAARRSGSPKGVVFAADTSEIAPTPAEIQIARLQARFDFSPSVAAAVAALAFNVPETWSARA